jgi:hypothetical protein
MSTAHFGLDLRRPHIERWPRDKFIRKGSIPGSVKERLASIWADPTRRARLLRNLWLVSTGFTLFGFAVMVYLIWSSR